jgi:hypothetical protein
LEGFTIWDFTTTSHRKAVVHIAPGTSDVVIVNNVINHSKNREEIERLMKTNIAGKYLKEQEVMHFYK